jgi:hypothetical protein
MSTNFKNILERAIKTFVEVAVTTVIANLSGVDISVQGKDRTFWIGIGIAAASAALSAVWNGVLQPWLTAPDIPPEE